MNLKNIFPSINRNKKDTTETKTMTQSILKLIESKIKIFHIFFSCLPCPNRKTAASEIKAFNTSKMNM